MLLFKLIRVCVHHSHQSWQCNCMPRQGIDLILSRRQIAIILLDLSAILCWQGFPIGFHLQRRGGSKQSPQSETRVFSWTKKADSSSHAYSLLLWFKRKEMKGKYCLCVWALGCDSQLQKMERQQQTQQLGIDFKYEMPAATTKQQQTPPHTYITTSWMFWMKGNVVKRTEIWRKLS